MLRRHATPSILFAVASLLFLSGCSSDGPTDLLDDLSAEEAELMMEAITQAGGVAVPDEVGGGEAGPVRVVISVDVDSQLSCPEGGTIRLTGSFDGDVDEQTGEGEVSLAYTQTHQNCSVRAPSTGDLWIFDGLPDIGVDFDLVVADGAFTLDGTQSGTVGWSTNGRSGNCTIDVTYAVSGSETSLSGTVSGTVCGHQISTSVDVSTT